MISISPYIVKKSLLWIKRQVTKGQKQEDCQRGAKRQFVDQRTQGKKVRAKGVLYIPEII